VIASLSAGDVIGEMAYLAGGQRNATVSAQSQVRALRVEYETLTALLSRRPALDTALRAAYDAHRAAPLA
jgi:CRP-like cAMP-binding protein